jgi:hypothetical protein
MIYQRFVRPALDQFGRALDHLKGVGDESLTWNVLPGTMKIIYAMCLAGFNCAIIPDEVKLKRPRIDTLLDGLRALIRAKQEYHTENDSRMANLIIDVIYVQFMVMLISSARDLLAYSVSFTKALARNLLVWESEAHEVAKTAYLRVREIALADPDLKVVLAPMEKHLFEAAERAAEQAEKNRDLRREAKEEGKKEGVTAGRKEAEEKLRGELRDLTDTLFGSASDTDKDRSPNSR